jgi:hypothetical protein
MVLSQKAAIGVHWNTVAIVNAKPVMMIQASTPKSVDELVSCQSTYS